MSQGPRTKHPLDVLQSMINGILIETGKALRSSNKEGGKTFANAKSRLSTTIPSAIDNFQQALDELECDILRAKSVLLRDLEALRAKRLALENPVPIFEEIEHLPELEINGDFTMEATTPEPTIKVENTQSSSPEKHATIEMGEPSSMQNPAKEDIVKNQEDSKEKQGSTPNPSNDTISKPIGLGINTEGAEDSPAPGTSEPQNSAVDSLFDIPDNENAGGSDLNFESMDFSLQDSTQDPSQTQSHDFDLLNFESNTQDYNISTLQPNSNSANNSNTTNKEGDDTYGMGNAGDNMDLDIDLDFGTAGGEISLFNEMYDAGADGRFGGGGEMEHGEFDKAFFDLTND